MHKRVLFEDISVTIFKEGDRSLQVKIPVRIHAAHAQSAWAPFLNHVKRELELEDIEGIYDDVDGAPALRTASLIDGGLYFARPTEVSAMLRSLVRTEQERYPAWPSIEKGLEAKRELERCRDYYEQQLLPMPLTTREDKAARVEVSPHEGDSLAELWAMKVKQGFKCKVYKTPACRPDEVVDVLPMGTIVTLSTDWGEAMEKHPQRGKSGKGKVLWMVEPQEGFLERRPLEVLQANRGDNAVKAEAAAPPPHVAAVALTPEERMGIVRGATKMSKLLRSTLRRGAYFEGAAGVHSFVEVHRAALRAAATLMRKDPASREGLLECRGIELFVLIVNKFCEEDRLLCEYGCWALAVFAGEGDSDSDPSVFRFQEAVVEAGGLAAVGCAVDAHRDSAQLRRYGVSALAAIVHENASTAGQLHCLNLHATVAEDSIRRWPNDPELSCLACWVLRSVVEPPSRLPRQGDLELGGKGDVVLHVGIGGDGGSVVGSKFRMRRKTVEEVEVGSAMPGENSGESSLQKRNGGGLEGDDSLALGSGDDPRDQSGDVDQTGGGGGGGVFMEGSTMSGSVFGMGDNETSDLLISLADDDDIDDATTATGQKPSSPFGQAGSVSPAASTTTAAAPVSAVTASSTANKHQGLEGVPVNEGRRDAPVEQWGGEVHAGQSTISSESPRAGAPIGGGTREAGEGRVAGQAGVVVAAAFEGEEDGEVLERLLKLAEATKVLNHDNEDTRKAASRLVGAILRQIDSTYVRSSRRRRRASQARVARVLREGQAIGAL
ncbi:unnamed protein product [Ectocarpus sp. 12 AP-2014]